MNIGPRDFGPMDAAGKLALALLGAFLVIALGVWSGAWGQDWDRVGAELRAGISAEHWFGTNALGQDLFARALRSAAKAFEIGVLVAAIASSLGLLLGGLAGQRRGGWLDEFILWLAGVLDGIPFLLFVVAVAWALDGHPAAMHIALITAFWTTTARLVRAEVIRLDNLPFVESARALGLSELRILWRHLLPNTFHIALVQATILFVAAIKTEVILSFLGLGLREGVSWGVMIAEAPQDVLAGHFGNFLVASSGLFLMILSFNLLADTLQDLLDPRRDRRC